MSTEFADFRCPFDGTQPEVSVEEKRDVANRFSWLVHDTLLRIPLEATGTMLYDDQGHSNWVTLGYPLDLDDEAYLHVNVTQGPGKQNDSISIEVKRYDGTRPLGRARSYYSLHEDGVVIRTDHDDTQTHRDSAALRNNSRNITEQVDFAELLFRAMDTITTVEQNMALEKEFGVNHQPIGLDEYKQLASIVASSDPINEVLAEHRATEQRRESKIGSFIRWVARRDSSRIVPPR